MMINETLKVVALADCKYLQDGWTYPDSIWRQTIVGCRVLEVLQDMYRFNMTYQYSDIMMLNDTQGFGVHGNTSETSWDVHVRPLAFTPQRHREAFPINSLFTWRYGFTLRRSNVSTTIGTFYSMPFTRRAWNCLYAMTFLVTTVFYILHCWEKRLLGVNGHPSFSVELLVAIGAYCQHVVPIRASLSSRRIAYSTFFLFSYVIYSYYSSNLLSHMVVDKDEAMTLHELAHSDYEIVVLDDAKWIFAGLGHFYGNKSFLKKRARNPRSLDVKTALGAVWDHRAALLSDFVAIAPSLNRFLQKKDVCDLKEIDLFNNIEKYFVTDKDFAYKEQFKLGILKMKESGVLNRILNRDYSSAFSPICIKKTAHIVTDLSHVAYPLTTLFATSIACFLLLAIEILHYRRNRVYPFVN